MKKEQVEKLKESLIEIITNLKNSTFRKHMEQRLDAFELSLSLVERAEKGKLK